jgi:cytoskeletal protein RodZ
VAKESKIIRRPDRAEGGVTPAELKAMEEHSKLWIDRAFRTAPIEPEKIVPAIETLYAAAGLKKPRVVVVSSPLVMAFAYGAAAAIWHERTRNATDNATYSATYSAAATASATDNATYRATDNATRSATSRATDSAIDSATRNATDNATRSATYSAAASAAYSATYSAAASAAYSATYNATDSATRNATDNATYSAAASAAYSATYNAIDSATRNATDNATYSATYSAAYNATRSATISAENGAAVACRDLAGQFGLECATRWASVYQGGNMWAPYDCFLTAMRDIIGLRLAEHSKYEAWEQAAIHGGFRVLHPEFCIVSDFPEVLKVDDQNLPHCEDGPSHRWRDGWSLYHWHGVKIPGEWIENRNNLDAKTALTWDNIEQRRAACELVGWERILRELDAKVIDTDEDPMIGELVEVTLPDVGREKFLRVVCGTGRRFALPVPPHTKTALDAQAWTYGVDTQVIAALEART